LYQYRTAIGRGVFEDTATDETAATEYCELLQRYRTEQEVTRARIVKAGLDPDPPADWNPTLIASPVKSAPTDRQ